MNPIQKILDESTNDELWVLVHFWLNHLDKPFGDILKNWKCGDCADFSFCDKNLSPPQCADIAAVSPRIEYGRIDVEDKKKRK